jgi:hypothetical protein
VSYKAHIGYPGGHQGIGPFTEWHPSEPYGQAHRCCEKAMALIDRLKCAHFPGR